MKTIRCSSAPRVVLCPASLQVPDVEIDTDSEPARLGSAVHEVLAAKVRREMTFMATGTADGIDFHAVSGKWRIEHDQMMPLYYIGRRIYEQYSGSIEVSHVEQLMQSTVMPGLQLTGHGDVIGMAKHDPHTVIVLDWKTGSPSADYRDQLIAYAYLATIKTIDPVAYPDGVKVNAKIITVWLRDQVVEIEDISQADIADWLERLNDAIEHPDKYGPSPEACQYCPRQHECPARTALVHSATADFLQEGAAGTAIAPARLASLRPRAQMLRKALDNYDAALKATIEEHGTQPLGDGREIGLDDRKKETINLTAAIPVLEDWFGNGAEIDLEVIKAIAPALDVGKGKLTKLLVRRVGLTDRDNLMRIALAGGADQLKCERIGSQQGKFHKAAYNRRM